MIQSKGSVRVVLVVVTIILLGIVGFFLFQNNYLHLSEKQNDANSTVVANLPSQTATMVIAPPPPTQERVSHEQCVQRGGYETVLRKCRFPDGREVLIKILTARLRDAARFFDLRGIQVELELYFDEKHSYPSALDQLVGPRFLAVPHDPSTNRPYEYATQKKGNILVKYHLGASLEELGSGKFLSTDADFDSQKAGWSNGFNGADNQQCTSAYVGSFCFDKTD